MNELELPDFSTARVMVIGDVMLDRYLRGAVSRISPEAPVPVVKVESCTDRPGGAGNVALNIASLGAAVALVGQVGGDPQGDALLAMLERAGVKCRLRRVDALATITKMRVVSQHQQLLRLDFEDLKESRMRGADIVDLLNGHGERPGLIIVSDYAKGTVAEVDQLIAWSRAAGCAILIDPKGADFGKYRGAAYLTPNMAEFEAVVGRCHSEEELAERGAKLVASLELEGLLITRGERGMSLIRRQHPALHLAAHSRDVFDVTGAGDTVIAIFGAALAAGASAHSAAELANTGAGLVVEKFGAASVTVAELGAAVGSRGAARYGVVDTGQLLRAVASARLRGERIVLCNGCFDILHAGHVACLEQARALGDRLVVAVDSDTSVRRLKGAGRPANGLDSRMAVLAALAAVDWVVGFEDGALEALIEALRPDVLVKGGDYRREDVVGRELVEGYGGEVQVVEFVPGVSTTAILDRIKADNGEQGVD